MISTTNPRTYLAISLLLLATVPIATGKIIYVDVDATGADDGTSWVNDYNFLQDALGDANSAEKPVEIRVAQGIYTPDQGAGIAPGDREATFQLINGVTLAGGYAGNDEPHPNARNIELHKTILSGDLSGDDVNVSTPDALLTEPTRFENSYHVVTGTHTHKTAALDGFYVTAGNANGSSYHRNGGGMYSTSSYSTLKDCTFSGNSASVFGGGIYNDNGSPTFINCTISRNTAAWGGGIGSTTGSATLINCIVRANAADEIFGSATASYSNVEGGIAGEGNIDVDPLFADPENGDFHVKSEAGRWDPSSQTWVKDAVTSPCVDTGDPASDWTAELWPHGRRVNMGAFSGTAQASMSLSSEGNAADCDNDDFVDARDLLILCENWLTEDLPTAADINRDGVVDFRDYAELAGFWLHEIPRVGLVAHWELDEMEGSIAHDSIGDNDATLHGPEWTDGKINGALHFEGFNAYLDCGESELLGPAQMTLAMWLQPAHMGGMRYIASRAESFSDIDYAVMRHRAGEVEFAVGQLGSDPVSVMSTGMTDLGEWSHVAVCLDGSQASVYIDGRPDGSVDYGVRVAREGHWLVVSSLRASTRFYHGKIDDVRLYNVALSDEDIAALHAQASE